MTCIVVICALLSGGGPRQCEPGSMEAFYPTERLSRSECRQVFADLHLILPANLRLVRWDYAQPQTAQVGK